MDKLHQLTVEDYRRSETGHRKDIRCPVCGGEKTEVMADDRPDGTSVIQQGTLVLPVGVGTRPVGPWMVPLTCTTCGYVMMFNGRILYRDITS